ncbi:MAG: peptidoglycan DD-metalloendopeptidase family protein [Saprospiraceae bacterium]
MKLSLFARFFPFFLCFFGAFQLTAQHNEPDHVCGIGHDDALSKLQKPLPAAMRAPADASKASSISVDIQPGYGSNLYYHPVAAYNSGQAGKAQISVQLIVWNNEDYDVDMGSVEFAYTQNGTQKKHTVEVEQTIPAGMGLAVQNGRDYHKIGDVIYIDAPIPTNITISIGFAYPTQDYSRTMTLVPYDQAFELPFKAYDLGQNELWESASTHGGGSQVFGYDMGVEGWTNGAWSKYKPGKTGTANEDYRCWGKPIYAMADGIVVDSRNTIADNATPGVKDTVNSWGNFFLIEHGDLRAAYCHFQMGSLNPALMAAGTVIKKGDFLGLTGNSGNSTGPHLHMHLSKVLWNDAEFLRPLIFKNAYAIEKTSLTTLNPNAPWTKLDGKGIPGYENKRSFIFPGDFKPLFSAETYVGVFRSGTDGHWMQTEMSRTAFVNQDNNLKNQGLRLTDISIYKSGTTLKYSGVWRAGTQNSFVQPGTTLSAFVSEWQAKSAQGLRLIDIETYVEGGVTKFAGVYSAGTWGHYLYLGMTQAQLNAQITTLAAQNYGLTNVEIYKEGNTIKYAGIWKAGALPQQVVLTTSWNTVVSNWNNHSKANFRLLEYDSYQNGTTTHHAAVFGPGNDGYALYAKHFDGFRQMWSELSAVGLRLIDIEVRGVAAATATDAPDETAELEQAIESEDRAAETTEAAEMRLFPNPSPTGEFTIAFDAPVSGKVIAQLFDMQGKLILQTQLTPGETQWQIRPGTLPSGIYALRVLAEGREFVQKLMVE